MSPNEIWNIGLHVLPVVLAIVVAVFKIGSMLESKLTNHTTALRLDFERHIDDLWKSQTRQDERVAELAKDHYRLEGRLGIRGPGPRE